MGVDAYKFKLNGCIIQKFLNYRKISRYDAVQVHTSVFSKSKYTTKSIIVHPLRPTYGDTRCLNSSATGRYAAVLAAAMRYGARTCVTFYTYKEGCSYDPNI